MKKLLLSVFMLSFVFTGTLFSKEPVTVKKYVTTDAYAGWRLGVHAWSFNRFSFYESIDKVAAMGFDYIEAFPGQRLGKPGTDDKIKMDHNMSASLREEVKRKLGDSGVKLFNYGVVELPNNEAECRKIFEFAKDMGIRIIVSEPSENSLDMIYGLCEEYKIKVAIHNHPKPSHYWHPDTVSKACKGRTKWIGACADVGNWLRAGLNPIECLQKLQFKLMTVHIKDLKEAKPNTHDVVWGTGKVGIKDVLTELHRQRFKGTLSAEYEYNWDDSVGDIYKSAQYFNKVASELKAGGWRNLFNEDLSNAEFKKKSWTNEMGLLTRKGGGDLWTKDKYSDFVLDLEFKLAKGTNSGVFLRAGNREWIPWIKVQVEDSYGKEISKHICGAIFDCLEPTANVVEKPGEWNHMTIVAYKHKIVVGLNGEALIDMFLNKWDTANKNPDGTKNKFDIAYKDLPREGYIGFQDYGQDILYRNVKIKEFRKSTRTGVKCSL